MKSILRSTRRFRQMALATSILAGCASVSGRPADEFTRAPEVPFEVDNRYVYRCTDDFRFGVRVRTDAVELRLGEETFTLPQVVAASGTRYSAEGITFWSKGMEASLETPRLSYEECEGRHAPDPWIESALLGNEFRAVGQEPGWLVEIDDEGGMHILTGYGETEISVDETPDRVSLTSTSWRYSAEVSGQQIEVVISEAECQDTMSGEEFPNAVTLRVGANTYSGCGRSVAELATSPLARHDWLLTHIGYQPVDIALGTQPAAIRFDMEQYRIVGYAGCNNFIGPFSMLEDRLLFRPVIVTTRLSCTGQQQSSQENRLFSALSRTDRYAIEDDGTLTFYAGNQPVVRFRGDLP